MEQTRKDLLSLLEVFKEYSAKHRQSHIVSSIIRDDKVSLVLTGLGKWTKFDSFDDRTYLVNASYKALQSNFFKLAWKTAYNISNIDISFNAEDDHITLSASAVKIY